jgi:hypothetical protein
LALVGSFSHAGLTTVAVDEDGTREIRRHSSDQKKKILSRDFSTGPPIV